MVDIAIHGPRGGRWLVRAPTRRRERMRGLMGQDGLALDRGLLLIRTRSVHTFGMRFPTTVVQLDDGWRVIGVRTMRPGRLLLPRPGVRHVLECPPGADIRLGDLLTFGS